MATDSIKIKLLLDGQEFSAELDRATGKTSSFAKKSSASMAENIVTWAKVAAAVYAAKKAFDMFLTPAMNAQEAASKFSTIFGEQSEQVRQWADNMGTAMARSSRELQSMAADAMALISPMSGSRDAAISMSQGLVQMAQDLASFHNVDVTEAFTALRSGISGETEPMKRFGIMLTDAALAEYALSQGITKRISDMTTAEKTQLRYNAMLANMGTAQGDAARTSGSLTNQLRALEGRINDVSVAIGDRSIEGMTQLARGMAMVADESSVLVRGAQEASGVVGGLTDLFGREMQAEAYGRRLLETYDAMDQLDGVVIATTAHMGAALGTAGLGGIVNVMGMLKTDFGRLRVEYAVTSTQITSMSLNLAGRYGSLAKALEDSNDRQVQQFVRLRENLERLSDTARRTLGWDLSKGWLHNIMQAPVNIMLDGIRRYNEQQSSTRTGTGSPGAQQNEKTRDTLGEVIDAYRKATVAQSEYSEVTERATERESAIQTMYKAGLISRMEMDNALLTSHQRTQEEMTRISEENERRRRELLEQSVTAMLSTTGGFVSQVGQLYSMHFSNQQANLDNEYQQEYDQLTARYDERKAQIEATVTDETAKAAALKALDEQRAREEKALEDRKNKETLKLKRDAAKREKQIAIFETTLATPEAAIKAYKALAGIPIVGPALGFAAAAAATALGLAKLKLINDTPLPEAASGGYSDTPAIFGERGPELAFPLTSDRGRNAMALMADTMLDRMGREQEQAAPVYNITVQGSVIDKDGFLNSVGESLATLQRQTGSRIL